MKHPFIIMFGGFLLQLANCQPTPICRVSKAFPNPIAIPVYWMVSRVICIARLSRSKGMGRCTQLTKRLNMQNAKATWRLCAQTYCLPGAIGFTSQGWREIIKHKLRHLYGGVGREVDAPTCWKFHCFNPHCPMTFEIMVDEVGRHLPGRSLNSAPDMFSVWSCWRARSYLEFFFRIIFPWHMARWRWFMV